MVREARSGERISFVTSAKKGSLGLILEPSASGYFAFDAPDRIARVSLVVVRQVSTQFGNPQGKLCLDRCYLVEDLQANESPSLSKSSRVF